MGVDESLMDKVRLERASYASFGALVVMTAVVAAFSMWFAVQEMAGSGAARAILPGLIWFLFIYNMDRIIVTSRPGGAWNRWIMFVSRAALAILLGTVIAEPLVLKVFQSQIETQVKQDRSDHLAALETKLLQCNPDPTDPNAARPAGDCATRFQLAVSTNPAAQAGRLKGLQDQAAALDKKITEEQAEIRRLNDMAAMECNGSKGPGLSGKFGNGINCRTDRANATEYENSVPLADQQTQLTALTGQITLLQTAITNSRDVFVSQRADQIHERLAELTPVDAPIGLLERMSALSKIGGENAALGMGIWLVRLLFICIDCSPVLIKMTHRSRYEKLVDTALDDAVETYRIALQGRDSERAMAQDEQEQLRREHAIEMDQRLADAVEARAAAYERQARADQRAESD